MTHSDDETTQHAREDYHAAGRPRAANWFWRPWYAKVWLGTSGAFWLAALVVPHGLLRGSLAAPLMLFFHPFLFVPVLGFGFFRAWVRNNFSGERGSAVEAEPADTIMENNLFYRMDPTDPANSRYYGHPGNPTSAAWLDRHVRGKH